MISPTCKWTDIDETPDSSTKPLSQVNPPWHSPELSSSLQLVQYHHVEVIMKLTSNLRISRMRLNQGRDIGTCKRCMLSYSYTLLSTKILSFLFYSPLGLTTRKIEVSKEKDGTRTWIVRPVRTEVPAGRKYVESRVVERVWVCGEQEQLKIGEYYREV